MASQPGPNGPLNQFPTGTAGIQLIKGYEKVALVAYRHEPKEPWTIGYGNTFYENGAAVKQGDVISRARAEALLPAVLPRFEASVRKLVTRPLLQQEFDALVCFAYNAGTGYTNAAKKVIPFDLWARVNAGQSGDTLFNYWTALAITSGGLKLNGLIRRRKSEVTLYQTGAINFFQ